MRKIEAWLRKLGDWGRSLVEQSVPRPVPVPVRSNRPGYTGRRAYRR